MCRQLIDPAEWDLHNGAALGDRIEWSNRACGIAALRMILLAHGRHAPTITELLHLGVQRDALISQGWVHAGLADLATHFGVTGRAEPITALDLPHVLVDGPIIVSVTEQFPVDGRQGGHLVIARGYDEDPDPTILIRDPSAWGQTHDRIPLDRLTASYTGRAITFAPLTARTPA